MACIKPCFERLGFASAQGKVVVERLDLTDLSSISAFADRVKAATGRLDYLILNAGVMMTPLSRTSAGWEMQFGTNHMGHFYLTKLLLPLCEASPTPARVVAVSSMGHRYGGLDLEDLNWEKRSYSSMGAYGASKSANIAFAHELTRRCKAAGSAVEAFSLHPGVIDTNLGKHLSSVSQVLLRWAIKLRAVPSAKSIPQGAATTVYAALAPELAGRGGAYLDSCGEKLPVGRLMQEDLGQELWARSEAMLEEALRK